MIITDHIAAILWVTGAITMLPILQFLFPRFFLARVYRFKADDHGSLFFFRHWGLLAACVGALLMYAAMRPELRGLIVLAATVEKAGLALMIGMQWKNPDLRGLRVAAVNDAICVLLYLTYLFGLA